MLKKQEEKVLNILYEYKNVYLKKLNTYESSQSELIYSPEEEKLILNENFNTKQKFYEYLKKNSDNLECNRCKKTYYIFVNKTEKDCLFHPGVPIKKKCFNCDNFENFSCCNLCSNCLQGCNLTFHV